jgi:hypothetical protein
VSRLHAAGLPGVLHTAPDSWNLGSLKSTAVTGHTPWHVLCPITAAEVHFTSRQWRDEWAQHAPMQATAEHHAGRRSQAVLEVSAGLQCVTDTIRQAVVKVFMAQRVNPISRPPQAHSLSARYRYTYPIGKVVRSSKLLLERWQPCLVKSSLYRGSLCQRHWAHDRHCSS